MARTWFDRWYRKPARPAGAARTAAGRPRMSVLELEDRAMPDATVVAGQSHNLTVAELEKPASAVYTTIDILSVPAPPAELGIGSASNHVAPGYIYDASNYGNLFFQANTGTIYTFDVRWQQYYNANNPGQTQTQTITVTVVNPDAFTVTTLADENDTGATVAAPGGTGLSLREAIGLANANPNPSTITFDPSLTASGDATINLTKFDTGLDNGEFGPSAFEITSPVVIQGTTGANGVIIQRGASASNFRLFDVHPGASLSLDSLTLSGGMAVGGNSSGSGGGALGAGGAVFNRGTLTVTNSLLTGNSAIGGSSSTSVMLGRGGGGVGASNTGSGGAAGGGPNGGAAPAGNGGFGGGGGGSYSNGAKGGNGGFGGGGGSGYGSGGNGGFGGGGSGGNTFGNSIGTGGFGGGNGATTSGGGGGGGMGGAIFNESGTVSITNSTLTANTATAGTGGNPGKAYGGAVFSRNGTTTVFNSTLAGNTAADAGGALLVVGDSSSGTGFTGGNGTVTLTNSILAGSTGQDDFDTILLGGTVTRSGSGDLVENGGEGAYLGQGAVVSTADPELGPLADNGGPTQTLAIGTTSSAYNAGSTAAASALTTDQRGVGFPRVSGGIVDIGAFEYSPPSGPYVVSTTEDVDDGDYSAGHLSLREAINLADQESGPSSITFDPTVFATRQTITLNGSVNGELLVADLSGTTTITGPAAGVVINGDYDHNNVGDSRLLEVLDGASAAVSNVEFTYGRASGSDGDGGAILNEGTLSLTNVTVSSSGASQGASGQTLVGGSGGAIASEGNDANLTLANVTLASNYASLKGGGLYLNSAVGTSSATLTNVTITANSVTNQNTTGGGLYVTNELQPTLTNTLVAGNYKPGTSGMPPQPLPSDITGTVAAGSSYNLVGSGSGLTGGLTDGTSGNHVGVASPLLYRNFMTGGALNDFGGPVRTAPLLPNSPAIDAGTATGAPTTDARGKARFQTTDIGAYESQGFGISVSSQNGGNNQSANTGAAFGNSLNVDVTPFAVGEPVVGGQVAFVGPSSGAGISGSPLTATVTANGSTALASQSVTANDTTGSYTVTAGGRGFSNPASFSLTNTPPLPTVSLVATFATADENTPANAKLVYTVTRGSTNSSAPLTVKLTSGGTASPADFSGGFSVSNGGTLAAGGLLTFPANVTSLALTIGVADDFAAEPDETLVLTVGADPAQTAMYAVGSPASATGTILANDFGVTNTNDSGEGSLRQALLNADAMAGPNSVLFDPTVFATAQTITLASYINLSGAGGTGAGNLTSLTGPAAGLTISGGGLITPLTVAAGVNAAFANLTLTNGGGSGAGSVSVAGTVSLSGVTVTADLNSGQGAVYVSSGGTLMATNSRFTNNTLSPYSSYGAAVTNAGTATLTNSTISGNSGSRAGGVYNTGTLTVSGSTFSGNTGTTGYGAAGGLFNSGGTAAVGNSTFSGNTGSAVGAVSVYGGSVTVSNSTISGNTAGASYYAGGFYLFYGSLTLNNSVVAHSVTGPDLNYSGGSFSGSYDLIQDGRNDSTLTNVLTGDPLLGSLADNGGPTQTLLPQPGSPLVGAGSNVLVLNGVNVDQIGNSRVVGTVDIGSVEIQDTTPATVTNTRVAASVTLDPTKTFALAADGSSKIGLPVRAIDVSFDEPVTATTGTLRGLPSGITVSSIQGSGTSRLRFVLTAPIQSGTVTLTLALTGTDAVRDLAGNLGLNASYSQTFSVRFGDYDGSGSVTSADLSAVRAKFTSATVAYDPLADFNGDGTVDAADYNIVRGRVGQ